MPTFAEESAFMEAIQASFKDDGPRLIFADYLDESSDPIDQARAEFIRIQIALARLPEDSAARKSLVVKQGQYLFKYQDIWTRDFHGLASGFQFRRGILESVSLTAEMFARRGHELIDRSFVRRVKILQIGSHLAELAQSEQLGKLAGLDLCNTELNPEQLERLLQSRHLNRLQSLDLSHNQLGNSGLVVLARTQSLPKLKELSLCGNSVIGSEGLEDFCSKANMPELDSLDLSSNDLNNASVKFLVESRCFPKISNLQIQHNRTIGSGVSILFKSPLFRRMIARIHKLDLRQTGLTAELIDDLVKSNSLGPLHTLDLSFNDLRSEGLILLAESNVMKSLRRLSVSQNRINDEGGYALAYSQLMNQLRYLDISSNQLSPGAQEMIWLKAQPSLGKEFQTVVEMSNNL